MDARAQVLLYIGSSLIALWGVAHLFPTKKIIAGFGTLTPDNRRVLTMEWLAEGFFLVFLGVAPLLTLWLHGAAEPALVTLVRLGAVALLVLAAASFSTLWRTSVLPNRMCPWVKTAVAVLYLTSTFL
jgi:hypothetical protein